MHMCKNVISVRWDDIQDVLNYIYQKVLVIPSKYGTSVIFSMCVVWYNNFGCDS